MAQLFWFHAFDRTMPDRNDPNERVTDEEKVVDVLRNGPTVNPNVNCDTRVYEGRLQIHPNRVYAYLGRTLEKFGDNAVVLPPHGLSAGHMSPFDTGGLINKIAPISTYQDEEKVDYLMAFTWDIAADRDVALATYPSNDTERFQRYLDAHPAPEGEGPHIVWPGRRDEPLWTSNTDWRAWTWEGRAEPQHFQVRQLTHWTCSPSLKETILEVASRRYPDDLPWLLHLASTHLEGGVGVLVETLKNEQAAA